MTAVWPASLPAPTILDGWDETLPNNVVRTEMDAGPAKVRKRSSAGVGQQGQSLMLDIDQRQTFIEFWKQTLQSGSLPFLWRNYAEDDGSGLTGFGSCLRFAGGGYVLIPNISGYTLLNAGFTIEFMLKVNSLDDEQGIICKSTSGQRSFSVYKASGASSHLNFRAYDDLNAFNDIWSVDYAIPDTNWHRWSWTCDAAAGAKLYIDGSLVASAATLPPTADNEIEYGTAPITIGRAEDNSGTKYFANGLIDDVRIMDNDVLAADILAYAQQEYVGDEPGLVGYWKFNEGLGVVAEDSAPVPNNGFILEASYLPRTVKYRFVGQPRIAPISHDMFRATYMLEDLPQ